MRCQLIGRKVKSKEGSITNNGNNFVSFIKERSSDKSKGGGSKFSIVNREKSIILNALEMLDVGRNKGSRKIIHALVKLEMKNNLYSFCLQVIPKDVFQSVFQITQEDTLSGMQLQFAASFSRRLHPNSATKGRKITEVFAMIRSGFESRDSHIGCMADGVMFPM